ncbi:MAG: hypothetical protein J6Y71_02705 [Ruminococcus sp.]|nr:hypothetical protein [Ruminococcus sp.]
MNREIDTLYELCETISMELESCNEKIRQANGKLSPGDIDYLDKLTHTMKSLKAVIGMLEAQDSGYSGHFWDGRYYFDGGSSMEGSSNRGSYEGASGRGSYEGGSSNRGSYGRGRNANRDRMGRYAERGYSRADAEEDFRTEIEELMNKAPDEQSRKKLEKLMQEMK